jgi:hypothetical protein
MGGVSRHSALASAAYPDVPGGGQWGPGCRVGHHGVVAEFELVAQRPDGWRSVVPAAGGALLTVGGLVVLIRNGVVNFWPMAAAGVGVAALADRVLAFRPASIRLDGESLIIRSHLGFTDRRKVAELITVEWHTRSWRDAIIFNFDNETDNVSVSSAGYTQDEVHALADALHRTFLVDPLPNQEMPARPYDDPPAPD